PSIFKNFPRETAGDIVGAIFPKYFLLGYVSSVLMLATLLAIGRANLSAIRAPLIILALMTALAFVSGIVVGTKAHAIKEEIRQTTDAGKKEELAKSFKKIHGISMVINLVIIILAFVYIAYIPGVLRV
ncbi:MAG: DUF4149 domain-containing protein, partial [Nitrospinota bacterium]